jgi:hypothetical protein
MSFQTYERRDNSKAADSIALTFRSPIGQIDAEPRELLYTASIGPKALAGRSSATLRIITSNQAKWPLTFVLSLSDSMTGLASGNLPLGMEGFNGLFFNERT